MRQFCIQRLHFLARFARRLFVALTSEAVFKGDWRVQIPPPGMFKVYVTILRIQQFDFFSVRFARRLFLPLLLNLFIGTCLSLLFKLLALNSFS